MAETVFAMVQRQERERREAIARGEPDPFLVQKEEEPAREPNRLEEFEAWMATDWEFGPYYWEEGQERPEQLKERLRQRFWWCAQPAEWLPRVFWFLGGCPMACRLGF